MNQKDYKAIAGIMKVHVTREGVIRALADYFEKEDKVWILPRDTGKGQFNKQQFIKDCGVEK